MVDPWVPKIDLMIVDSILSRLTAVHLLSWMRLPLDVEVARVMNHQALTEGLFQNLAKRFFLTHHFSFVQLFT